MHTTRGKVTPLHRDFALVTSDSRDRPPSAVPHEAPRHRAAAWPRGEEEKAPRIPDISTLRQYVPAIRHSVRNFAQRQAARRQRIQNPDFRQ